MRLRPGAGPGTMALEKALMKASRRQHMVLTGDLRIHAIREVCQGAAEYIAEKSLLDFDP
jgi:hypothetical protein